MGRWGVREYVEAIARRCDGGNIKAGYRWEAGLDFNESLVVPIEQCCERSEPNSKPV